MMIAEAAIGSGGRRVCGCRVRVREAAVLADMECGDIRCDRLSACERQYHKGVQQEPDGSLTVEALAWFTPEGQVAND